MKKYLKIIFFLGILFEASDGLKAQVNSSDSLALVDFFYNTNGAGWNNNTNWLTGPVSTWYGISVFNNRVTSISLVGNSLSGSLPFSLGTLSMMSYLNLSTNDIFGPIPGTLGDLSQLVRLNLSHNKFTGSLPDSLGLLTNLMELYLNNNNLTDTVRLISNIDSLKQLYLNDNMFTRLLDITNHNLTHCALENNRFTFKDFYNNLYIAADYQNISPQAKVGEPLDTVIDQGSVVALFAGNLENASEYQWYRNGQALQGATNSNLILSNIQTSDTGTYYCEISNLIVHDLTLYSEDMRVSLKANAVFSVVDSCSQHAIFVDKTDLSNYTENVFAKNWDLDNDGYFDDAFGDSISVNFNNSGILEIGLQLILSGGQKISDYDSVEIFPSPVSDFSLSAICAGSPLQVMNHSSIDNGSLTYKWNMGDSTQYNDEHVTHVYNDGGSYMVKLVVRSDHTCYDSTYFMLPVYEKPQADFDYTNPCEDKAVYFQNKTVLNRDSIVNIEWIFDNTSPIITENTHYTFGQSGFHNVKLIITTQNGCEDTSSQIVQVNGLPNSNITPFPAKLVCYGDSIELGAFNGYQKYYWSTGDTVSKITVKESGVYDVLITSQNNCQSQGEINVQVLDELVMDVSADTTISKGEYADMWASGADTYDWSPYWLVDNSDYAEVTARLWNNKEFTIVGTDSNSCKDTMTIRVNVLNDFKLKPYNIISPNGDGKNDVWKIENIESYSEECSVFIYDRSGNEIAEFEQYNNDFDGSWNNKELPTGTYYYIIRCSGLEDPYKGDLTIIRK